MARPPAPDPATPRRDRATGASDPAERTGVPTRSPRKPAGRSGRRTGAADRALAEARRSAAPTAPRRRRSLPRPSQLPWSSQRTGVGDHTRFILRRRNRTLIGSVGTAIVVVIVAAVLVLPVRAWLTQRTELAERRRDLAAMNQTNADLRAANDRLKTVEGIKAAAREDLGMIEDGETVIAMLPSAVNEAMPTNWPYSAVSQILAAREASIVALAPAVSTLPATVVTTSVQPTE